MWLTHVVSRVDILTTGERAVAFLERPHNSLRRNYAPGETPIFFSFDELVPNTSLHLAIVFKHFDCFRLMRILFYCNT
jgi:hypothetical protein